jgi:hypothetical protein
VPSQVFFRHKPPLTVHIAYAKRLERG